MNRVHEPIVNEVNCHYLLRGRTCLHLHSTSMEFHGQVEFENFWRIASRLS